MPESELIQGCLNGDPHSQKQLFKTFAGKMMAVCMRYALNKSEAEDMLQDGFLIVFKKLHQYNFQGSFEGWIRRIMVNVSIRALQKKKQIFFEISSKTELLHSSEPYVYSGMSTGELLKMIAALPLGYKTIFNLYVIEGYSHEEIGKMLQIKPATSRSQLLKARKMLQKQIIQLQKVAV